MDPLVIDVGKTIGAHSMITPGKKVAVALSGGPDSVALLFILQKLAAKLCFELLACHFDHNLRPGSKDDADFAKNLTKKADVPIKTEKWNSTKPETGLQEKARKARYDFFDRLVSSGYADLVAIGHTKDDSVETSIMWMLRGAGLGGFGGIPAVRDYYIRPLIDTPKKEVLAWLSRNNIEYLKDPTNESDSYRRNRIRQNIIPSLMAEAPKAVEIIARLSRLSRATNEVVEELSRQKMSEIAKRLDKDLVLFDIDDLIKEPDIVRYELYRHALAFTGLFISSITLERIEAIDRMVTGKKLGKKVELPSGYMASADHGGVAIGRVEDEEKPLTPAEFTVPFTFTTSAGTLTIKTGREGIFCADRSKIPSGAKIRGRRPGDYLALPRGDGTKKLKKFFIDRKVPKSLRNTLPLLAEGAEILYLPRLYISPRIMANETTKETTSFLFSESQ